MRYEPVLFTRNKDRETNYTFNDIFIFLLREASHVDFVHEKRHMDILESSTKYTNSSIFVSVFIF